MKVHPSFDFDVRQEWIDLSLADDVEDDEEDQRNWEWFQVPHTGHASPRKPVQKPHQQQLLQKAKTVKVKEEDHIKQMLKEHNAKVKNARLSNAGDARYAGHQPMTTSRTHRKPPAPDERKSSLDCNWHSIPQESLSRHFPKEDHVYDYHDSLTASCETETESNRRKALASPGPVSSSLSHQSPDPSRIERFVKSPHEDLQELLDELKAKQTPQPVRVVVQAVDTKGSSTSVKRKLPKKDHVELQLLVQQHNDKHKLRRLSSSHHSQ
ncbi:hypothetical protein H310_05832 [Aphanomyces invadans]|uniref:Uncharacterized protein n=1 Tax=Aphanomyces invadans TaxID=157072 RepID=A0A024U7N6_9STRA|nr:hypothetical protein H310_05832 [Aphanomyces invadans]ETW02284.1 hypothetical protein H310_05832 [Aphanomyces invadans]|eukprot:XP_008868889.1 hypothetical protein H310_05832 [Aphanomyces invadans]